MEDYYELLGVSRDAATADVKQAYRERIKEVHPDVSDEESASDRTKELIEAKEVLTDPAERARYDRLGHEAYVSEEASPTPRGSTTGDSSATSGSDDSTDPGSESASTTGESDATATSANRAAAGSGAEQATAGTGTDSTSRQDFGAGTSAWYDSSSGEGSAGSTTATGSRAWDTGRSYSVNRESGNLQGLNIFTSQRSIVMFLSTFLVYPILLFGSLSPQFPVAVNLVVAGCTVLVIAFLQSVPSVGMVVFGIWTLLLPPVLVLWIGVSPFSLVGLLAITGVAFPCGLSALTWFAIRPMSIT